MAHNYLGGYYVVKQRPIDFGGKISKVIYTCSNCINDSLLDHWAYTWTTGNDSQIEDIKAEYQLSDEDVHSIRKWVDNAFNDKRIGWINLFKDLSVAEEYIRNFFPHLSDLKIISVYFPDSEVPHLLSEFQPADENRGAIGLYENLMKRIPESTNSSELPIGYDIIGIELDGGFHTCYCHDVSDSLAEMFQLEINEYGLFQETADWEPLIKYMNAEENGFEPVPWFVCKTKLVRE